MADKQTDLEPYVTELECILGHTNLSPREWGHTQVLDFLYLTSVDEALKLGLIEELGITHVINCAAMYCDTGQKFYGSDIKYIEFLAEDEEGYDMMQHFDAAYDAIEDARLSGGKALIHCVMGVNRSGLLTAAYVMLHNKCGPLTAAKLVHSKRDIVLTNESFQKQLIEFAHIKGLLHLDKSELGSKI